MNKIIEEWKERLENKKYSESTIKTYIENVKNAFANSKLKDYETCIEKYFVNASSKSTATIKLRITNFNAFQKFLIEKKYLDKEREIDLGYMYSPARSKKNVVKVLTHEDKEILFEKGITNLNDKLAITIYLQTGVRDSEFADYLNNVNELIENRFITVKGKSASNRQVLISEDIKNLAKEYKKKSNVDYIWPKAYSARDKRLKAIATNCGLKLNLHMFRATFATEWVYHGHDIVALQQAMGHSTLAQLDPYIAKNQLILEREWNNFSRGENHHDVAFLKNKIKMLEEANKGLRKTLKECLRRKYE